MSIWNRPPSGQPWYKDGLRFTCKQCGRCCRGEPGYVWVTTRNIREMASEIDMPWEDFCRRYVREIEGSFSLMERPNGDCIMWDAQTGCRVYRARPIQCRTFPFWPEYLSSPAAWQRAAQRCPAIGCGELHSARLIKRCLKELADSGW